MAINTTYQKPPLILKQYKIVFMLLHSFHFFQGLVGVRLCWFESSLRHH